MKLKPFLIVLIIIIIVGAVYLLFLNKRNIIKANFICPEGKFINAEFLDDKVKLVLSDQRRVELPRVISGSGARYANTDESFVFWNKGNTAFIEENGQTTFTDCETKNN